MIMTNVEPQIAAQYVRSVVGEQVRGLREIIHGLAKEVKVDDDIRFIDHLLQMVSIAVLNGPPSEADDLKDA